jgi:hypothetical protein
LWFGGEGKEVFFVVVRVWLFFWSGFVSWVMIATLERKKKYTISESER